MSVNSQEEQPVQIPMEIVVDRLRTKLQESEWRVILLESQIEMLKKAEQAQVEQAGQTVTEAE